MMHRHLLTLSAASAIALVAPPSGVAQSEQALKDAFEGKMVVVRIDMPATDDGIDVYAARRTPIDFPKYQKRLKSSGTALKVGDRIMVTKVKLKKDLIEFQLGGGGYGTLGDNTSCDVYTPLADKTRREKDLERDIPKEKDPEKRKKMSEELDALHKERDRQDALLRATASAGEAAKCQQIRQQALASGSRFNIRYDGGVPPEAISPDAVRKALASYVDFGDGSDASGASDAAAPARSLRRGLTELETESLLGKPTSVTERAEGRLSTKTAVYDQPDRRVEALFVEGILVRYSITSK